MTLEELWELFPITLQEHNPAWSRWAAEEIDLLHSILSAFAPQITHIGSTAIPGIMAKPIVDILVEVPQEVGYELIKTTLIEKGYICMNESVTQMSFNKGYTPEGYAERVFHIHVHRAGDNAEIRFRDYLRTHREAAVEYELLKQSLAEQYKHNRDAYTEGKTEFVRRFSE